MARRKSDTTPESSGTKNLTPELIAKNTLPTGDDIVGVPLQEIFMAGATNLKSKRKSAWTPQELILAISDYFSFTSTYGMKPCKAGIRTFLGISVQQYIDWEKYPDRYGELSEIISMANNVIEMTYITRSEKYPASNIFLLKSSHGHVENSKITIDNSFGATQDEIQDQLSNLGFLDSPSETE